MRVRSPLRVPMREWRNMVDALRSDRSGRKVMRVRFSPHAPYEGGGTVDAAGSNPAGRKLMRVRLPPLVPLRLDDSSVTVVETPGKSSASSVVRDRSIKTATTTFLSYVLMAGQGLFEAGHPVMPESTWQLHDAEPIDAVPFTPDAATDSLGQEVSNLLTECLDQMVPHVVPRCLGKQPTKIDHDVGKDVVVALPFMTPFLSAWAAAYMNGSKVHVFPFPILSMSAWMRFSTSSAAVLWAAWRAQQCSSL